MLLTAFKHHAIEDVDSRTFLTQLFLTVPDPSTLETSQLPS
jgi:hypothetical protein